MPDQLTLLPPDEPPLVPARDDLDGTDDRHDRADREMWNRAEQTFYERYERDLRGPR